MKKINWKDGDPFGDEVVTAFVMTSLEQRERVYEDWTAGRQVIYRHYADLLRIDCNALLLASLLQFNHPSVIGPRGPLAKRYDLLMDLALAHPVDNCPETVDNPPETVDKVGENPVDRSGTYPQFSPFPPAMM